MRPTGTRATSPHTAATRVAVLVTLSLGVGVAATADTVAIRGAKVHPVSGPPLESGTVVISDGKITAVGENAVVPQGARVIEGAGRWVTPGLVNAATALGLVEIGLEAATNDDAAKGDRGVSAAFRAWDALNPASPLWAPARNEGVTSIVAMPSGGLVAGQAAFVDVLDGNRAAMIRRAPAAMLASVGSPSDADARARGELFLRLRELLEDARVYASRRQAFESAGTRPFAAGRLDLEALQPVLDGRLPLVVAVDRAADIETTLDLAREYKVRLAILGGAEAWMVAGGLAAAGVPVLTTGLDNIPSSFSSLGARQENAALLRKAGVPVVITAGRGETFNARNVKQHAGNAVAYGLPWNEALRAVTLTPAEVFGVDAALGSLQAGKDANLVVWDGDPFEFTTRVLHVFVRGREVEAPSREDLLTDRYRRNQPR